MILKMAIAYAVLFAACVAGGKENEDERDRDRDLGIIPIGAVPSDLKAFDSTDCDRTAAGLADCSATDGAGRRYAFFDGALSVVSAVRDQFSPTASLPAGLVFGEDIKRSVEKASSAFNVAFDSGKLGGDGVIVYSSDFVIPSSCGVVFSLELIADSRGRLERVVQRTDF